MRDDQLREELASWLAPAQHARPPDVAVIRRRLRRRRARNAIAGAAVCVLAAGSAAMIQAAAASRPAITGPGPTGAPPCAAGQLHIGWAKGPGRIPASPELPPLTWLLGLRNTGTAACSLSGWPKLAMTAAKHLPRQVSIAYGTVSSRSGTFGEYRTVEQRAVVLRPGARAVAAVTVSFAPESVRCARPGWTVTPPRGHTSTMLPPGQGPPPGSAPADLPLVCSYAHVAVSPVYPAAVPLARNYPASAPAASPATVSASAPAPGAVPGVAPYFVTIDLAEAPSPAVVHDSRTGKVTAIIRAPAAARGGFTGVAAAGDDRIFVLAAGSRFYGLTLSGGRPVPGGGGGGLLTPLPVPRVAAPGMFAVSQDGSELALAMRAPGGSVAGGEIMVVSLVTGWTHTWRSAGPGLVTALSWADPGSSPAHGWAADNLLAFGWTGTARSGAARHLSGLRVLDTGAPGTNLLGSRLLIPATVRVGSLTGLSFPLISASGTAVFVTMTSHAGGSPQAAVVEFSLTRGLPAGPGAAVVVTPLAGESGMGTWCGALWADPSAAHALVACQAQGQVDHDRFVPGNLHFPALNFSGGTNLFAW